jgi:TRAP-type mannitol/chloroaromatic compound transport system substrate-binding protein
MPLVEAVEKMSGGRLIINLHPAGEIVPAFEQTTAVRDGLLDMALTDLGADQALFGPKAALLGGSGYPAGSTSDEDWAWINTGGGIELAREVYKDYAYPISNLPEGQELFAHSNKPLETAEDLKGVKHRVMGFAGEVLATFGMSIVNSSFEEIYPMAEKGVVDSFECGGPALNWSAGFHEVSTYIGTPGIHSPGAAHCITVNFESWNELPDDLKNILVEAVRSKGEMWRVTLLYEDSIAMQNFKDYGMKFFTVSDELQQEIAKRSLEITEKHATEDPLFAKILEHKRAFLQKFIGMKKATTLGYSIYYP